MVAVVEDAVVMMLVRGGGRDGGSGRGHGRDGGVTLIEDAVVVDMDF